MLQVGADAASAMYGAEAATTVSLQMRELRESERDVEAVNDMSGSQSATAVNAAGVSLNPVH